MTVSSHSAETCLPGRPSRRGGWMRIFAALLQAQSLLRQRHRLQDLDDDILRDIGLTRDEALIEAQRPFWDGLPVRRR